MGSNVRIRGLSRRVASILRSALSIALAAGLIMPTVPVKAYAENESSIFYMPDDWASSPTNPSAWDDYSATWREGWGNHTLPEFNLKIPQPSTKYYEPAVLGAVYYTTRPGSTEASINPDVWQDCYMASMANKSEWTLNIDIPSEYANRQPGDLFSRWWEYPYTAWTPAVETNYDFEGPYQTFIQYYAKDMAAAASSFTYGLDVTPPSKVESLSAIPGFNAVAPTGWLTQSRVILKWKDKKYDDLAGTGYFEAFIDGKPYPTPVNSTDPSRRVYDLKEHYPGYGVPLPTKREMTIEDLPAGSHTLQVRAVDRATNEGPLSDSVVIKVDPDIPNVSVTCPDIDGEYLGAKPVLAADASDMAGIQYVKFTVAKESAPDVPVFSETDTTEPYQMTPDMSAPEFTDGSSYIVTAETADMAGRTFHRSKTFRIDKKPTIKILAPNAATAQPSLVALKVLAEDKTGVSDVDVRVDGVSVKHYVPASADDTSVPLTMLTNVGSGPHTLSASVSNASGGTATVSGGFWVDSSLRPSDTSLYLPELGDTAGRVYANGWFNATTLTFNTELDEIQSPSEVLYAVDRSPLTAIDPSSPNLYYSSSNVADKTTLFTGTVDLNGVYLSDPTGFSGSAQTPAAANPIEGLWYTHALVRNATNAGATSHTVYGVDLTKPTIVTGAAAYADAASPTPATDWLDQSRIVMRWDGEQYDSLSGVSYYKVYVDGSFDAETGIMVPYEHARSRMAVTIEDLAPGPHTLQVSAVDMAGNEGPMSVATVVKLRTQPSITIASPASENATLTTPSPLRAQVKDPAGIASVRFAVDGSTVHSFVPVSTETTVMVCNWLQQLAEGPHTLTVTALSNSGTAKSVSRQFNVDKDLPPIVDPGTGGGDDDPNPPVVKPSFVWFKTTFPTFLATPSELATDASELLYLVDRTPDTPIDPTDPNAYYISYRLTDGTTHVNGVVDQIGILNSDPLNFDGNLYLPGRVSQPVEGVWYMHAMFRNAKGEGSTMAHAGYGVDLTQPNAVTGVQVYKTATSTSPMSGWADQSRVVIRWDGSERDVLSGTDHYKVYVDGQTLGDETENIPFMSGTGVRSVTIEDLGEGSHKIQVTAVDRAGNESALSSAAYANLDRSAPAVRITAPGFSGQRIGASYALTARATDAVGVASVTFKVDGISVGTVKPAGLDRDFDAKLTPAWSNFAAGTHTLTVYVTDHVGHTVQASRTFYLDKYGPKLSSIAGGYNPFYPRKQDGYRDYYKVKFSTSEAGTAYLTVKDSKGNTWRTLRKSVAAGATSITWDGKSSSGSMKEGTFRWYLRVRDAAGNYSTTASGSTSLRYYIVVQTSSTTVKLVAH